MCSPTIVLDKIVEKLVDIAFESVGRHLGYLFHYKQNMKNLEVEMNKLQERRGTIERKIDEAKNSGEVIVADVSDWLNVADRLRQGVESLMEDKTVKENVRCFKFSCPDFNSRYRLSKEAERIMEALIDSKVNVIGVYGTGGVGKTTTVEKVGEQVKKDGLFDEVVMAVVSQDAKVAKIQGVLAVRLNLKLEEKTEEGKAIQLWNRLNNGKRNLVILDDIWKKLDLKEIGFWGFDTRECRGLPVAILAVGAALKGKRMYAWTSSLDKLRKSMLNNIEDIDPQLFTSLRLSYDHLESKDAKSCFLLCCLFPEDAQVPIDELVRHCMARRLLGQNPDTLEEARDIVCSVVNTLKTSCLLLDGENDDFVKMHDIVRDVAISIAKEEEGFLVKHGVEEWPETGTYEKYSAISLSSETIDELPEELVCPELHTLMLECTSSNFQSELSVKIPDRFFRGIEKLMVLELNNVTMLPLPSSLGKLTELRMLCLIDCKLGDIAILECLKNKLEVLRLRGSNVKALPPEVGELTRLRLLDLGDCNELKVIPNGVISKLYRLEELHFPRSFENWEGTTGNEEISKVSLDELMTSLTRLSTLSIHIPNHRLLPKDPGFQNLIRFNITVGDQPSYVYRDDSDSEDYSVVGLSGIHDIDDDFNILERLLGKPGRSFNNLTELVLEDCRLKYLFSPSCARGLLQLQRLVIDGCGIMEAVIGNEGENDEEIIANVAFPTLETLHISSVPNITEIWDKNLLSTESFCLLRSLEVKHCGKLMNVVLEKREEETQEATNKDMFIVQDLSIYGMPNITEIWDKNLFPAESFCLLRSLNVMDCEKLMNVVPSHMLPQLKSIENLEVSDCPEMEAIVILEKREEETQEATNKDMIIVFPQLRKMELRVLENLKGVYVYKSEDQLNFNVQDAFPSLEELSIYEMPNITEIWDKNLLRPESFCLLRSLGVRGYEKLKSLTVQGCKKLMNVVPSHMFTLLKNIETLYVSGCPEMEVIVVLEKWEEETQEVTTNKDMIISFPELRSLKLHELENLKGVCAYKSEDRLCFNVQGCKKLMNVVPSHMLPLLKNIETLEVSNCPEMEVIVVLEKREEETQEATNKDMIIVFPQLREMTLRGLENLKGVCAYKSEDRLCFNVQVAFPSLEELSIYEMPNITEIWDKNLLQPESFCLLRSLGVRGYEELRSLTIMGCTKLMNVVPSHMLPLLKNIETLKVSNCPEMEVIVVLEKREEETQEATTNKDMIILFPELWGLTLQGLENLKGVCAYKSEDRLCFNVQVTLLVFIKTSQENPDPDKACTAGPDAAEGVPTAGDVVEGGGVWRESDGLLGVFVGLPALDLMGLLLGEDAADGGGVVDDGEGGGRAVEGMGWIEGDGEEGDYSECATMDASGSGMQLQP
ncbi:hypothetical protein RHGRI_015518 [Rhododendron griersonianum]|uniref:AAA+ ATPase domain-containing protein n=1 Tax=Rhododendron griersonianum TaxID=479676 RepID=A0AAV6KE53_9ERIC|nr:hypothetical protein RHGRI_015518 [Rhododendron griersonianum]